MKTLRIFYTFSIVKFECHDQLCKMRCHFKAETSSNTSNEKLTIDFTYKVPLFDVLHHNYPGGALECQEGVSGSSKNSRNKGLFFTIEHYRCVNRVSNSCKIGLKGYDFWRSYVFRVVFHAEFVLEGNIFGNFT